MRKTPVIPRILKINDLRGSTFTLTFNNGEKRQIDYHKLLRAHGFSEGTLVDPLFTDEGLAKANVRNHTLSFDNVKQFILGKDGKEQLVPFEIGADVLYIKSTPLPLEHLERLAISIRNARKKAGLSQRELAQLSGTSRTYISRIENQRSDIELTTLKKIVEIGLGKELRIVIK